jgi:predicted permease
MFSTVSRTIRELLQRRRANREVDEELEFHLEMETQANIARGLSPDAARRRALAELGGIAQTKEAVREVRASWIDSMSQDLGFALRVLRRNGTGWTAAGMLALAIAITTAMFTIVDALFLRPAPFEDPDRLAFVYMGDDHGGPGSVATEISRAWREGGVFAGVEAATSKSVLIDAGGSVAVRTMADVTPGMFELLRGVRAIRGRLLDASDAAFATDRIVISEDIWTSILGRDPNALGRSILIDGQPLVIVGIVPASFRFPSSRTAIWRASQFDGQFPVTYVRFRTDLPQADAERRATEIARAANPSYAKRGYFLRVQPLADLVRDVDTGRSVPALAGGVLLVFLILCANASGLLLARLTARQREFAMRSALGASRRRLLRQAALESTVFGATSVIAGGALSWVFVSLARAFLPEALLLATLNPLDLDGRAFAAASLLGALATSAAGLFPAWIGTRVHVGRSLTISSRSGTETCGARLAAKGFLIGQIALASMLLIGATLLVRSFLNLASAPRGLDVEGITVARINFPAAAFVDAESRASAVRTLEEALRGVPEVEQVTWSYGQPPGGGVTHEGDFEPDMRGSTPLSLTVDRHIVQPTFFDVYRIPLIRGRVFTAQDGDTDVVVGERLADLLWPGVNPLGHSFLLRQKREQVRLRVIGVAREIHNPTLNTSDDNPEFYTRQSAGWMQVLVMGSIRCRRVCPDPAVIRQRLTQANARVQVDYVRPVVDWYLRELARPRAAAALGFTFAAVGTVAAAGGLFSVLSYAVARRRREFGIRSALGASSPQLARIIVRDSAILSAAGLSVGTIAAWWMTRALRSLQYGVTPGDPGSYAIVIALLAATVAAASWWPARQAMRSDPVTLLREE